jgi:biopolymer transport protein ExbD
MAKEHPADTREVLQLDRELNYGTAVALLDMLRSAGIQRMALAVAP